MASPPTTGMDAPRSGPDAARPVRSLHATPPGDEPGRTPRAARSRAGRVLAGLLVVAALLLVYAYGRVADLERQNEALTAELTSVQDELQASRSRMQVVREHVDDLSARVSALSDLLTDE